MALKVNLRNNTSLYIKVSGFDDIVVPNTQLDDRTFSWESDEDKTITFYTDSGCTVSEFSGTLSLVNNDGIYVSRGNQTTDTIKLDADISLSIHRVLQETNSSAEKLLEFSEITPLTTVNLSYFNL